MVYRNEWGEQPGETRPRGGGWRLALYVNGLASATGSKDVGDESIGNPNEEQCTPEPIDTPTGSQSQSGYTSLA